MSGLEVIISPALYEIPTKKFEQRNFKNLDKYEAIPAVILPQTIADKQTSVRLPILTQETAEKNS